MRRSKEKLATIKNVSRTVTEYHGAGVHKKRRIKEWRVIVRDKWGGTQYACPSLKEARRLAERQEAGFNEKAFECVVTDGVRSWSVIK